MCNEIESMVSAIHAAATRSNVHEERKRQHEDVDVEIELRP